MASAAPIALRTRKSQADSRVTLFTLDDASESKPTLPSSSVGSSSPATRRTRNARVKAEDDAAAAAAASSPSTPATPRKRARKSKVEAEEDEYSEPEEEEKKPRRPSLLPRKPTPTKLRPKLEHAHPEPARWRETYEIIKEQRKGIVAAVDLMGCDAIVGMKDEAAVISDKDRRLASLVSLMLSSQTKDPVTHEATMNLRRNLQGGLCLEGILSATDAEIHACINKVGFWRRKTDYIRRTAELLRDKFDGDVPKTIEDLLLLPGVGPKMGFLCLQAAWGIQVGIGVDTHVHRITNRLGWHRKPTTDPEETRVNLESWLPQELHNHINIMLVGLGQTICLPVGPRCDLCHLGQMEDSPCPSKRKVVVKQAKAKAEKEETPTGEIGQMADTLPEVEEADAKPAVEVLLETVTGHLPTTAEDLPTKQTTSPFFDVKREQPDVTW